MTDREYILELQSMIEHKDNEIKQLNIRVKNLLYIIDKIIDKEI